MAYEVTATRRRPQRFCDLVGQEFVAATLENSLKTQQIANAYLFSGPRGCGKTSSARILAKALNCQAGDAPQVSPCGKCPSCLAIASSSSLDVIEIDGASNTSVNDVRQIKDEVMFPPNSSRYKIYIIDEVHMLSNSAFNALLKTIEEPPPHVVFIFATTELQKVPATIKSRCQQFNFRLVPVEKVKQLLSDACAELSIKATDEALYWIAKESGGSVRDSYTLFDQVASFSDGEITYEKIRDKLGIVGVDILNDLFLQCSQGDANKAITSLSDILDAGTSVETFVTNAAEYARSLLLLKIGVKKESLLVASADRFNNEIVQNWDQTQIEMALSLFLDLYRNIRYTISPRYDLELVITLLSSLRDYVSPMQVKHVIDEAMDALANGAAPSLVDDDSAEGAGDVAPQPSKQAASAPTQQASSADAKGSGDDGNGISGEDSTKTGDSPSKESPPTTQEPSAAPSLSTLQKGSGESVGDKIRASRASSSENSAVSPSPIEVVAPKATPVAESVQNTNVPQASAKKKEGAGGLPWEVTFIKEQSRGTLL